MITYSCTCIYIQGVSIHKVLRSDSVHLHAEKSHVHSQNAMHDQKRFPGE